MLSLAPWLLGSFAVCAGVANSGVALSRSPLLGRTPSLSPKGSGELVSAVAHAEAVDVEDEEEEEEDEEVPEDLADLSPQEQQRRIKLRSAWMMGLGTGVCPCVLLSLLSLSSLSSSLLLLCNSHPVCRVLECESGVGALWL
jgi:hypothetical protein